MKKKTQIKSSFLHCLSYLIFDFQYIVNLCLRFVRSYETNSLLFLSSSLSLFGLHGCLTKSNSLTNHFFFWVVKQYFQRFISYIYCFFLFLFLFTYNIQFSEMGFLSPLLIRYGYIFKNITTHNNTYNNYSLDECRSLDNLCLFWISFLNGCFRITWQLVWQLHHKILTPNSDQCQTNIESHLKKYFSLCVLLSIASHLTLSLTTYHQNWLSVTSFGKSIEVFSTLTHLKYTLKMIKLAVCH